MTVMMGIGMEKKMMPNFSQHFQAHSPALTWPSLALLHTPRRQDGEGEASKALRLPESHGGGGEEKLPIWAHIPFLFSLLFCPS